jgi:HAMP domain-containing protein
MKQTYRLRQAVFPKGLLTLIAILLAFLLVLFFIWLWYDIRITSLNKDRQETNTTSPANH